MMQALIFDCDGVLVDTEQDGHLVAFNRAFAEKGLDTQWSAQRYGVLLKTAGGKERMRRHFDETGWPVSKKAADDFILDLHERKTRIFMNLIESGALPLRPGVMGIVDTAIEERCRLAICSTSNEKAVQTIVDVMFGPQRKRHISVFAGDVVAAKKPDPAIYLLAKEQLGFHIGCCVVIEDSAIGLQAALAANMVCVVTPSIYTKNENFTGAAKVISDLSRISWREICALAST